MTPKDPNVSGWRPDFGPAQERIRREAGNLRGLMWQRVSSAWLVWNLQGDEWFADLPVVLAFDRGPQLEVCWEKFDDLSITWDTIDLAQTPRAWVDWRLEWRPAAHPALASQVGATIRDVAATRFLFTTENLDDPRDVSAVWLTTGLWLATDRGGLHIFDALDENGLSSQRPNRDAENDWRLI
jgi:hypothetical protein